MLPHQFIWCDAQSFRQRALERALRFVTTLASLPLSPPLDAGSTFRMTLRATGALPIALRARIERLEGGSWIRIGETAVEDHTDAPNPVRRAPVRPPPISLGVHRALC